MKTVLITGGTGLIGMRLSFLLQQKGYQVRHLSRQQNLNATYPAYQWNVDRQELDLNALDGVDAIVHLAGAGIADARWTPSYKNSIINSRVASSKLLEKSLQQLHSKPTTVVACSAIGYYGHQPNQICTEKTPKGHGFMSDVCAQWEASIEGIKALGIRTPIIRVGIVLSTKGGALQQLQQSYPFRVGAYFGKGTHYYSWIHLDDICQIFIRALEDTQMTAIYNGTAPGPVTNFELAQAIAKAREQKTLLVPVPNFIARTLMGEMAAVVLNDTHAVPQALQEQEYQFLFPNLIPALKDLSRRQL